MKKKKRLEKHHPDFLIHWLNGETSYWPYLGKPSLASRERVADLIERINKTDLLLNKAMAEDPDCDYWSDPPEDLQTAVEDINDRLEPYIQKPTVDISIQNGRDCLVISYMAEGSGSAGEHSAVRDLIFLSQAGRLSLCKKCDCRRWFFGRGINQRSCSSVCRHKLYEQTPTFKAKRRDYMRKNYALKKSGKVK